MPSLQNSKLLTVNKRYNGSPGYEKGMEPCNDSWAIALEQCTVCLTHAPNGRIIILKGRISLNSMKLG